MAQVSLVSKISNTVVSDSPLTLVEQAPLQGIAVVHVFRSPLGGLFRHVCDLAKGQAEQGLQVGIICDSSTGNERSDEWLKELEECCALGVLRIPIARTIGPRDVAVASKVFHFLRGKSVRILHGHGAKGGALARILAPMLGAQSVYIPHGGALHFSHSTLKGRVYLSLERLLRRFTDGAVFESKYALREYEKKVGGLSCEPVVVYNGLKPEEFEPVQTDEDAADFMFMGELRELKGIFTLVEAVALLRQTHEFRLLMVGQGPDREALLEMIHKHGLEGIIEVSGPMYPAHAAFSKGRCLVLPSLAESLPYMVLEAAAARKPLITTEVGGISEIFGAMKDRLLAPGDARVLAASLQAFLDDGESAKSAAQDLQSVVASKFSYRKMVGDNLAYYRKVLDSAG